MHLIERLDKIWLVNIFSFIFCINYAAILYSGSTFLSEKLGSEHIWVVYSLAAFFTILLNINTAKILKFIEIVKLTKIALWVAFVNLILLFFSKGILDSGLGFAIFLILSEFLLLLSSVMIEDLSKNAHTGGIRGRYISVTSLGYLIAPFLASISIVLFGLKSIFLLSSMFILGSLFILNIYIQTLPKISLQQKNFKSALQKIRGNRDIRNIIFTQFFLYTFYTLMIIYIPFKLESLNISLTSYLSVLLPFALSAFLIIPPWLGAYEDKVRDEKEILILSFIGLILVLIIIAFSTSSSLLYWAGILFLSRCFASGVETSASSYFYKKIGESDTGIISIFMSAHSINSLLLVPIFSLVLYLTDLKTLFLSIAFLFCFVLVLVSKLHHSKNYDQQQLIHQILQKVKRRKSSAN